MRRNAHRAMAAHFEILLPGVAEKRGAQIAQVCFDEIDRIEAEISRWNPSSETGVINSLGQGESTMVSEHCFRCLHISAKMYRATAGLFDVTIGPLLRCWLTNEYQPRTPSDSELNKARSATGFDKLRLDSARQEVTVLTEGLQVDFGGIGKGYALDVVAKMLRADFDIHHFLLNAGDSTVYAEGKDWTTGAGGQKVTLDRRALSGSSITVKGNHFINPHSGKPVNMGLERAWALARTAAESDALSTSLMLMSNKQVRAFCEMQPSCGAKRRETNGSEAVFGAWPRA